MARFWGEGLEESRQSMAAPEILRSAMSSSNLGELKTPRAHRRKQISVSAFRLHPANRTPVA
jgi:hypothetical protein